jgi:transposase-like protein
MPRSKYAAEEKLAILEEFKHSGLGAKRFERQHGIGEHTLARWQARYERDGLAGLSEARQNKHYSSALKLAMVMAYQNSEGTLTELALQYGLRSTRQLSNWISKYNEDKTLTASPSRKQVPTMSRKTTFEERIEVVEYVTKNKHSYAEAAEHFQVSYQQARSWVLKAKDGGYEALIDNRGHHKAQADLTENERLPAGGT